MDKTTYTLIEQIGILCGDPISALNINNQVVIIGTMTGKILMLNFNDKLTTRLSHSSDEHIASISFEDDDVFSIAVGDDFILRYQDYNSMNCITLTNYKTDAEHSSKCQSSYPMLNGSTLLIIVLASIPEGSTSLSLTQCDYLLKNIKTKDTKLGKLPMTNYSIPFDFYNNCFLWIEYHSSKKRSICIADFTIDPPDIWKYSLPFALGNISHARLLSNQRIFIVREMNICEIRKKNKALSIELSFKNIGEEVIATSICYNNNYTFPTTLSNANQVVIHENKEEMYMKLNTNANFNLNTNGRGNVNTSNNHIRQRESEPINTEEQKLKKVFDESIILLDINGNVNVYENCNLATKFNLNDVKNIPKEQIDKQFFTMNYPYYIKVYNDVYAITCDHGCYVISNNLHNIKKV